MNLTGDRSTPESREVGNLGIGTHLGGLGVKSALDKLVQKITR